ncbi:MAG: hypothetical protein V8R46_04185 [Eubacterium ramulus]
MTIDGEDWNYTQVRLKVTVSATLPRRRSVFPQPQPIMLHKLEKPGQPSVTNIDDNELNYNVVWSGISDESYCQGYQIYVREYSEQVVLEQQKKQGL